MRFTQSDAEHRNLITIADGVTVEGTGFRFVNTESGRVIGGVTFTQGGSTLVNELGGIVRGDASAGSADGVTGSAGSDIVINAGLIVGAVRLGDGDDVYATRDGAADGVDLGAGDDIFRLEGVKAAGPQAAGGAGLDTVIVSNSSNMVSGARLSGFESAIFTGGGNLVGFSGYANLSFSGPGLGFHNLVDSFNPGALVSVDRASVAINGSSVATITGGDGDDSVEVSRGGVVNGDVRLGAGNDRFVFQEFGGRVGSVTGAITGGAGTDTVTLRWFSAGDRTFDLAQATGFEMLDVNGGQAVGATRTTIRHASGLISVEVGSLGSLAIAESDIAQANVSLLAATLSIDAKSAIRRFGFREDGGRDQNVDLAQGDDRLSTTILNQGRITGEVRFFTGDDLYDGRAGSVGGVVYGNAGNDRLLGGAGDERFEGGFGADMLSGGGGDDVLAGGAGGDIIEGGAGVDLAVFAGTLKAGGIGFDANGSVIVTGADGRDILTGVERLRFADIELTVAEAVAVNEQYVRWGGRGASGAELAYWAGEIAAGRANPATVRAAILADPLGQANTAAVVTELYREYLGREPGAAELSYWDGQVRGGTEFAGVRAVIVTDPSGQAFAAERIASLYTEYLGRDPGADEVAFWTNEVRIGTGFAGVRAALVDDPAGRAFAADAIGAVYRDYGGRAASAGEVAFWTGQLRAGSGLDDVRNAVLDDGLGRGFTTAALSGLYTELFGRDAGASDQAVWRGLFGQGFTLDTARSTLTFDGGSAGRVGRLAGTAGTDEFVFETGDRHVAVSGFDPFADRIDLRALGLTGVDPLDAAHAREVRTLDGGTDVLILLGEGRDLILRGVALGQLGAEDFLL